MTSPSVPLSFYVIFHERCAESRALARELFHWFRMKDDDGDATEAGLPVWYRCRLDPHPSEPRIAPAIDYEGAALNVVIVLLSDKLVNDQRWRLALEHLVGNADEDRPLVLPVSVDESSFRLTFFNDKHQTIRIGHPRPQTATKEQEQARLATRSGLLRRAVMETVARAMRNGLGDGHAKRAAPHRMKVFISHAKRDGAEVAEQVRDRLAQQSQLEPWYDTNDMPPGFAWYHPMVDAAKENTAALVSVVSDAYATRYWCRQEVKLARTPRCLDGTHGRVWTVQPAVALHTEGGAWRRPMAPLSHVVHIGWRSAEAKTDAVQEVVDRLLLEILLAEFYRRLCTAVADSRPKDDRTVYLSFVPDPWTLTRLAGEWRRRYEALPTKIVYPGFGLRTAELRELLDIAEDLGLELTPGGFTTLEELGSPTGSKRPLGRAQRPIAVLSAGGTLAAMAHEGVAVEHADDLLVRLSLRLLRNGWRLSYGGTLGNIESNVTKSLLEVARGYTAEQDLDDLNREQPTSAEDLDTPPLINYAAWPNHRFLTERNKAQHVGICKFIEVMPDGLASVLKEQLTRLDDPLSAYLGAQALTKMRRDSAKQPELRVVVGGKVRNWSGWLPGIAEEVEASLHRGTSKAKPRRSAPYTQPFIILGGFGGCAGLLAKFLEDPSSDWPRQLGFEAAESKDESFRRLLKHSGARDKAYARFEELEATLRAFRDHLWRLSDGDDVFACHGSPTRKDFLEALSPSSSTALINAVMKVAHAVYPSATVSEGEDHDVD